MVILCADLLLWLNAVTEDSIHEEIELEKEDKLQFANNNNNSSGADATDSEGAHIDLKQLSATAEFQNKGTWVFSLGSYHHGSPGIMNTNSQFVQQLFSCTSSNQSSINVKQLGPDLREKTNDAEFRGFISEP